MGGITRDLRYGLRGLVRSPGFTVVALLTLTLAIGANTALFSVLNTVVLRPLPFPHADRIVMVWGTSPREGDLRGQVSFTDAADWKAQSTVFEDLAPFSNWRPILSGVGEADRVAAAQVADGFFAVLGGRARLGRLFLPEDQQDGNDNVVVIGHDLWQRRFGGDPDAIGATVRLNLVPYTVVGILQRDFHSLPRGILSQEAELYRPLAEHHDESMRAARHLRAVGRLREGVTLHRAQAQLELVAERLAREHPENNAGTGVRVVPLKEDIVGNVRPVLLLLFGAVIFVLWIGCANVSNLLLARSALRRREVAIRSAIGAGRAALVRQFLIEGLLLSAIGGALGLVSTIWIVELLELIGSSVHPSLREIRIDPIVLAFTSGLCLLCGIVFGLAPTWHAARLDLVGALKLGGKGLAGDVRRRTRSLLVVGEFAMAVVLLAGAGLLIGSVLRLSDVDPGFDASNQLVMDAWLPWKKYRDGAKQIAFLGEVERSVAALPGVESAGFVSVVPTGGSFDRVDVEVRGRTHAHGREPVADRYVVTPGYLRAMSIRLLRGRLLDDRDVDGAQRAVLVSETMAQALWPGDEPIGRQIRLPAGPDGPRPWLTVAGVVADVKQYGLDRPGTMQIYLPLAQYPWAYMTLVARTASRPLDLAPAVRAEVLRLDPDLPVFNVTTMDRVLARSMSLRRFSMFLLGAFAVLALVLSAVGLYSVISYGVVTRTSEIGVRMALGARRGDVLRLILGQGLGLATVGLAIGLLATWPLTRLLQGLLYAVAPGDPATLGLATLLLTLVAVTACCVPAWRASRVDPAGALRDG